MASRLEQVVDSSEEGLESRVSQGQMYPFDCVKADDGVVVLSSLQIEEVVIDDGNITREFLSDCQSSR